MLDMLNVLRWNGRHHLVQRRSPCCHPCHRCHHTVTSLSCMEIDSGGGVGHIGIDMGNPGVQPGLPVPVPMKPVPSKHGYGFLWVRVKGLVGSCPFL